MNNKNLEIEITLDKNTHIYNEYNKKKLSDNLSNYIYSQCKGIPATTDIVLKINHDFKIHDEEKEKIIDAIRENYGIDIKENLLKIKFEHTKEFFFILLGCLFLIVSNILNAPIIGEIVSIFGCVTIWEVAYNIIFVETQLRRQNKRLKKLTLAKVVFNMENIEKI